MKTDLYIPKILKIGFQERKDTFTGKLAFVSYVNQKGMIFYQGPWEKWRDKKIEIMEIENLPRNGYIFNKDLVRDNYHFSSGRSIMRVFDTRGFEFEITIENLTGILSHSDISKSEVAQECIFAWSGQRLILLPTNSKEYLESLEYTEKQHKSVSKEDLKIGCTYLSKNQKKPLIFIGQEKWFDEIYYFDDFINSKFPRKAKGKKFVFAIEKDGKYIYTTINPETIAECIDETVHEDFSDIKIVFEKSLNGQPGVGFALDGEYEFGYNSIKKKTLYKQIENNIIMSVSSYDYNSYYDQGRKEFKSLSHKGDSNIKTLIYAYYIFDGKNLERIGYEKHRDYFDAELFKDKKILKIEEISNYLNKEGFKAIKLKSLDGTLHDIY